MAQPFRPAPAVSRGTLIVAVAMMLMSCASRQTSPADEAAKSATTAPIELDGVRDYTLPGTGLALPPQIGPFTRGGVVQRDPGGTHVSVAYATMMPPVTLYVFSYPAAADLAPPAALDEQFLYSKKAIADSNPGASLLSEEDGVLHDHRALQAVYSLEARMATGPLASKSLLLLTMHRGHFLKFRATYPVADANSAEAAISTFFANLELPADGAPAP